MVGRLGVSQFEYVAVLISIIVGLALTQLLRGVGRMVTSILGAPCLDSLSVYQHYNVLVVGISVEQCHLESLDLLRSDYLRDAAFLRKSCVAARKAGWSQQLQRVLLPESPLVLRPSNCNHALGFPRYLR